MADKTAILSLCDLPSALLGRAWPAERVLMGLAVNKFLHSELLKSADDVLLVPLTGPEPEDTLRRFRMFSRNNVLLRWKGRCDGLHPGLGVYCTEQILTGMLLAMEEGLGGSLTQLEMRDSKLGPPSRLPSRGARQQGQRENSKQFVMLTGILRDCPRLSHLELIRNGVGCGGIAALSEALKGCSMLSHLGLGRTHCGDDGAIVLGETLMHLPHLTSLDLFGNLFGLTGLTAVTTGLTSCSKLTHLNLSAKNIGAEGAKQLQRICMACTKLQSLNVRDNQLGEQGAQLLASGLRHCSSLRRLDLHSNCIGDRGLQALCETLACECAGITHLELGSNSVGSEEGVGALAAMLGACTRLLHLGVCRNRVVGEDSAVLARALRGCAALDSLDMAYCEMSEFGVAVLGEELGAWCCLRRLDLSGNKVGRSGVAALVAGLRAAPALSQLSLHAMGIGKDGALSVAELVQTSSSLTLLSLVGNKMEDAGAAAIVAAVVSHQQSKLDSASAQGAVHVRAGCKAGFGRRGGEAQHAAHEQQGQLELVDLRNNGISAAAARRMAASLRASRTRVDLRTPRDVEKHLARRQVGVLRQYLALSRGLLDRLWPGH